MPDLLTLLPFINISGFIILGAAMIYTQWRIGSNKAVSDGAKVGIEVIQTYKEQVEILRKENVGLRNAIQELTIKVTKLESAAVEKDKKIAELTLFLTGRAPSQEEYMKRMDALREAVISFIQRSDDREEEIFTIIRNRKAYIVPLQKRVNLQNKSRKGGD